MATELSLAVLKQITASAKDCVAYLVAFSNLRFCIEFRDPDVGLLKKTYSELIRHVTISYPLVRQHSHCFDQFGIDPADTVQVSGKSFGNAHFAALELARLVLATWSHVAPNDWEVMLREDTLLRRLRAPEFDVELVFDQFEMIRDSVEQYLTGDIASLTARIDREHALVRKQIEGRMKRSWPVSPDDPAESVDELLYRDDDHPKGGLRAICVSSERDIDEKFRKLSESGKPMTIDGKPEFLNQCLGGAGKSRTKLLTAAQNGMIAAMHLKENIYRIYFHDHNTFAAANGIAVNSRAKRNGDSNS